MNRQSASPFSFVSKTKHLLQFGKYPFYPDPCRTPRYLPSVIIQTINFKFPRIEWDALHYTNSDHLELLCKRCTRTNHPQMTCKRTLPAGSNSYIPDKCTRDKWVETNDLSLYNPTFVPQSLRQQIPVVSHHWPVAGQLGQPRLYNTLRHYIYGYI